MFDTPQAVIPQRTQINKQSVSIMTYAQALAKATTTTVTNYNAPPKNPKRNIHISYENTELPESPKKVKTPSIHSITSTITTPTNLEQIEDNLKNHVNSELNTIKQDLANKFEQLNSFGAQRNKSAPLY